MRTGQGRIQEERAINQTVDVKAENVKLLEADRERVIRHLWGLRHTVQPTSYPSASSD